MFLAPYLCFFFPFLWDVTFTIFFPFLWDVSPCMYNDKATVFSFDFVVCTLQYFRSVCSGDRSKQQSIIARRKGDDLWHDKVGHKRAFISDFN